MSARVYMDWNATAPLCEAAREAFLRVALMDGNPSSVHREGRAVRSEVEAARRTLASALNTEPAHVIFTSGATEAANLVLTPDYRMGRAPLAIGALYVSAVEHKAVHDGGRFAAGQTRTFPVDARGVADLAALDAILAVHDAAAGIPMVALMLANNETGVIQVVDKASALVRAHDGWLHVDAVQAAGKIAIDFSDLGADTMALSAHKLGGPQGVGALVAGTRATVTRRLHGGGQERGRRAGTENVAGIAAFGAAAVAAQEGLASLAEQAQWRDALAERVKAQGAVVLGEGADRLPQTLCLAGEGFGSEVQVMNMDLAGVMVSAGSACSSGKVKASRVVEAMGRADLAPFALRISGGWASTEDDWIKCGDAWLAAWKRIGARRREVA